MKVLLQLLQIEPFENLALPDFFSLMEMEGILRENLLVHEGIEKRDFFELTKKDFSFYPFVVLEVDESDFDKLLRIQSRSIMIRRFVQIIEQASNYQKLNEKFKSNPQLLRHHVDSQETYYFMIDAQEKKTSIQQVMEKIQKLDVEQFKGKCDFKAPQRVYFIGETYTKDSKDLQQVFFGKQIGEETKHHQFNKNYYLNNRPFIGPTTTDHSLAFTMVNIAQVKKGHLVFDPFFGTGSLMISAGHFGAVCYGADIDLRVLQGYGVGRLQKKSTYSKQIQEQNLKINSFLNFKIYGLNLPEIIRINSVESIIRFKNRFDSIICDPPYGIRAAAKHSEQKSDEQEEFEVDTKGNNCMKIVKSLFNLARVVLRKEGKIVFLFPAKRKSNL